MAQAARWMRMRLPPESDRQDACAQLAAVQGAAADPILVWLRAAGAGAFALIAPLRLAPGRAWRWLAWGAMPAIATCRQYGVPAYLEGDAIWLHGRRVAPVSAGRVGECALIAGDFPPDLARVPDLETTFRQRVEAQHGWRFETAWPSGREARR